MSTRHTHVSIVVKYPSTASYIVVVQPFVMTYFERTLHDDFSAHDSTQLWMANTPFASYPPASYSSMYDAAVSGYQSDFDTSPQSISSSAGSPSSDDFDFLPSFADDHAGARGGHHDMYDVDASATQLFSGDKFSNSENPFDALGLMDISRLEPPFLMGQPPHTVHMSDVIVPNPSSPSTIALQSRSDVLPSSTTIRPSTRSRQFRRSYSIDRDGESEIGSEGDSYCPSNASGPPTDHLPVGPASPLVNMPVRRRRRQDINLPVPVPNLTKKSRGRKVPTSSGEPLYALSKDKSKKGTRTYTCHVDGCGKCFVRSEHLKRHIRSIHTNDKPWVCPVWGCERSFSRRDNLNQHARIHKSPSN